MSEITEKLKVLSEKWANLPSGTEANEIADECMDKLPEVLERVEKLERSCAEMRDCIEWKCECPWNAGGPDVHHTMQCLKNWNSAKEHALSTSCGSSYIHRDEVKPLVEALRDAQMFIESYFIDWELMATSKNYKPLFPEIVERLKQASTQAKQMIKGEKGEN